MKVFFQNILFVHFFSCGFLIIYLLTLTHIYAPLLYKIRPYLTGILALSGFVFLGITLLYKNYYNKLYKTYYFYLGIFLLVILGFISFHTSYIKEKVLSSSDSNLSQIGTHIILGFETWEELETLSNKGLIGGIYITARNLKNTNAEEIRLKIENLQAKRKSLGLPVLFVTADQEGGMVSRLSPPLKEQPTLRENLSGVPISEREAKLKEYTELQAKELQSLGVNVNFSPVVDLYNPEIANPLDMHTQIHLRSISDDARETAQIALNYTRIHNEKKILTTYKHFPGLGDIDIDTHFFTADHKNTWAKLKEKDILPYEKLSRSNAFAWIMLSHTRIPDLDPENPISLSHKIIKKTIREELGWNGVLITDDLSMGPMFYRGIPGVSEKALLSGVDFLLLSYDKDLIYPLLHSYIEKDISNLKPLLEESNTRIQKYQEFLK